jgi:choline dehydrogenase-like flavoprotein
MSIDWSNSNTQPGIFLEYKTNSISSNWIHVQLSTPNEMVIKKLGLDINKINIFQWIKKKIAEHLLIAHGNIHSDHSNGYFITLRKAEGNKADILYSRREHIKETHYKIKKITWKLFNILRKIDCYVALPFVKDSIISGSFHVGGSMPMMNNPKSETDTNLLGSPKGWNNVHVIDSSILPSLPATTIGLVSMANATRIAS